MPKLLETLTQVQKVYEIMYKNATRYMKRKYDKFQELIKQNENSGINI